MLLVKVAMCAVSTRKNIIEMKQSLCGFWCRLGARGGMCVCMLVCASVYVCMSIYGQCLALVTEKPRYSVGGKEPQASWQLVVLQMAICSQAN